MVELLPDAIVLATEIAFVRFDNVDHHLGILFLLIFGDTAV